MTWTAIESTGLLVVTINVGSVNTDYEMLNISMQR
jgi:hypothetical protein